MNPNLIRDFAQQLINEGVDPHIALERAWGLTDNNARRYEAAMRSKMPDELAERRIVSRGWLKRLREEEARRRPGDQT